jgi:hypothetical protein
MIILFLVAVIAAATHRPFVAGMAFGGWFILTMDFARKRLHGTSHSPAHVTEMIVTSMLIPFLSVFWTIYGSIRFKTFFL